MTDKHGNLLEIGDKIVIVDHDNIYSGVITGFTPKFAQITVFEYDIVGNGK